MGRRGYDQAVRYSTVLFDLDGTLIDSGDIILSSFRHATKTVLEREIPDEVLAAAVGGSNIYDQMRAFDEERVDELVRVYRAHNEPLHDDLVAFEGIEGVLGRFRAEGRRLGIVTAKRRRTVDLAFAMLPLEQYFDAVVTDAAGSGLETGNGTTMFFAMSPRAVTPEQIRAVADAAFNTNVPLAGIVIANPEPEAADTRAVSQPTAGSAS